MQILRLLWELGPSPVREIHRRLEAAKGTNYSTTVKMLSVMLDKGLVRRDESARPLVYRAAASRQRTQARMLQDLICRAFDGSAKSLVLQALSSQESSADDLAEIRHDVGLQCIPVSSSATGSRFHAPHFVDIEGRTHVSLLTGGLSFHRRSGERTLPSSPPARRSASASPPASADLPPTGGSSGIPMGCESSASGFGMSM